LTKGEWESNDIAFSRHYLDKQQQKTDWMQNCRYSLPCYSVAPASPHVHVQE